MELPINRYTGLVFYGIFMGLGSKGNRSGAQTEITRIGRRKMMATLSTRPHQWSEFVVISI